MYQPQVFTEPRHASGDPILTEKRYRVRVEVQSSGTAVPHIVDVRNGNNRLKRGTHEIVCYESQLPHIMSRVETEFDEIERARRINERNLNEEMAAKCRNLTSPDLEDRERRVRQSWTGSTEAEFTKVMKRGILPLKSAEILEELPPPEVGQASLIKEVVDKLMGATHAGASAGVPVEAVNKILDRLDALESRNRELEAQLADKPPVPSRRRRGPPQPT